MADIKPKVKLTGTDGNVFALLGRCTKALKQAGQSDKAHSLAEEIWACESYNAALSLMMEYCDVS